VGAIWFHVTAYFHKTMGYPSSTANQLKMCIYRKRALGIICAMFLICALLCDGLACHSLLQRQVDTRHGGGKQHAATSHKCDKVLKALKNDKNGFVSSIAIKTQKFHNGLCHIVDYSDTHTHLP